MRAKNSLFTTIPTSHIEERKFQTMMTCFLLVCFLTLGLVQFSYQDPQLERSQGNFTDLYQKLERLEMKVTNQNVIIETQKEILDKQNVLIDQLTSKPTSPFNYNIAKNKSINASATCGIGHMDIWCKIAEYDLSRPVINNLDKECNFCTTTDTDRYHPANHANDDDESTWWQSPPISRGLEYNQITLDIDLEEVSFM